MERPALQCLLADIAANLIEVVLVYKVDRLTRSLTDFAKLVELFEAHGVSFVSVTQQFNTTTSMGRLTLNVLLSFAQFEREVAGERIRDKFAASRRKGMWMGGNIPLGYDVVGRRLVVNAAEAKTVKLIFERYLELGCVLALQAELERLSIRSKHRVAETGRSVGGGRFSRGALYYLLRNRVYRGEAVHKGVAHPGEHDAILDEDLWESVQAKLSAHASKQRKSRAESGALLMGLIFDDRGNRMSPSYTTRKGRRHRYYVSQACFRAGRRRQVRSLASARTNWSGLSLKRYALTATSAKSQSLASPQGITLYPTVPATTFMIKARGIWWAVRLHGLWFMPRRSRSYSWRATQLHHPSGPMVRPHGFSACRYRDRAFEIARTSSFPAMPEHRPGGLTVP
jgi:DNA invertase Pin-like site-specific DNA recombinase